MTQRAVTSPQARYVGSGCFSPRRRLAENAPKEAASAIEVPGSGTKEASIA